MPNHFRNLFTHESQVWIDKPNKWRLARAANRLDNTWLDLGRFDQIRETTDNDILAFIQHLQILGANLGLKCLAHSVRLQI